MTKHLKYQIELSNGETFKFKTMREICEFLGVSYGSLYSLRSGRLKCKHSSKQHLQGIKITKLDFDRVHKVEKNPSIDKDEFYQKLKENYSSVISQPPAVQES